MGLHPEPRGGDLGPEEGEGHSGRVTVSQAEGLNTNP